MTDWSYEAWPSREPYPWPEGGRTHPDDLIDFHVDLGCGRLPKGRIGVDRYPAPGVNVVADLNTLRTYAVAAAPADNAADPYVYVGAEVPTVPWVRPPSLPFRDSSIESMVTHHALEHIGDGFIRLMDECYRVLKPGAPFRIIVPLFPSLTAVEDPDHCRYFMEGTFDVFCGTPGNQPNNCGLGSFSVPYTRARFTLTHKDFTPLLPIKDWWGPKDRRELRVTLRAEK